jgi:hypothetical protein
VLPHLADAYSLARWLTASEWNATPLSDAGKSGTEGRSSACVHSECLSTSFKHSIGHSSRRRASSGELSQRDPLPARSQCRREYEQVEVGGYVSRDDDHLRDRR